MRGARITKETGDYDNFRQYHGRTSSSNYEDNYTHVNYAYGDAQAEARKTNGTKNGTDQTSHNF